MKKKRNKMHYRITKVYHESGKREDLSELLNKKRGMLKDFDGLRDSCVSGGIGDLYKRQCHMEPSCGGTKSLLE